MPPLCRLCRKKVEVSPMLPTSRHQFTIRTDQEIKYRQLDAVIIDKDEREYKIINKVVPRDPNIKITEAEIVECQNYSYACRS